jgi:hypothetical protein
MVYTGAATSGRDLELLTKPARREAGAGKRAAGVVDGRGSESEHVRHSLGEIVLGRPEGLAHDLADALRHRGRPQFLAVEPERVRAAELDTHVRALGQREHIRHLVQAGRLDDRGRAGETRGTVYG